MLNSFISLSNAQESALNSPEYKQFLQAQFGAQHQKLIPIVAVADMFYACQQNKKVDEHFEFDQLVKKMSKEELATRLIDCLSGESIKSDVALNYGLKGCFQEQIAHLPEVERKQQMKLIVNAIGSLSREERQKSFTQCVTDQAIRYLQ